MGYMRFIKITMVVFLGIFFWKSSFLEAMSSDPKECSDSKEFPGLPNTQKKPKEKREGREFPKIKIVGRQGVLEFIKSSGALSHPFELNTYFLKPEDLGHLLDFLKQAPLRGLGLHGCYPPPSEGEERGDFSSVMEVQGAYIGLEEAQILAAFLRNQVMLEKLTIEDQPIGYEGVAHICESLQKNLNFTTLRISYPDGDSYFSGEVEPSPFLESALRDFLKKRSLRHLELVNALSLGLLEALSKDFIQSPLEYLDLSSNYIQDKAAQDLVEGFLKKDHLQVLVLEGNYITKSCAKSLRKMINETTSHQFKLYLAHQEEA